MTVETQRRKVKSLRRTETLRHRASLHFDFLLVTVTICDERRRAGRRFKLKQEAEEEEEEAEMRMEMEKGKKEEEEEEEDEV